MRTYRLHCTIEVTLGLPLRWRRRPADPVLAAVRPRLTVADPSTPTLRPAPEPTRPGPGEAIYEFSDARSRGLLALRRDPAGRLVLDCFRLDPDVLVRVPSGHAWTA